ncbi:MAG: hypothetical protein ABIG44_08735 [Planctomycetota bacterium]
MMSIRNKRLVISLAGALLLVAAICVVVLVITRARVHTITGTITALDVSSRTATLEFVHPKSGRTITLEGSVPLDCDIRIDDRPADLADLRVGEEASVGGAIHGDMSVTANWVRISRATVSDPTTTLPTRQPDGPP